jgi:hypothetical protein
MRSSYKIVVGQSENLKSNCLLDLGANETIICKPVWRCGMVLSGSGYGLVAGSCEGNNGSFDSVTGLKFLIS